MLPEYCQGVTIKCPYLHKFPDLFLTFPRLCPFLLTFAKILRHFQISRNSRKVVALIKVSGGLTLPSDGHMVTLTLFSKQIVTNWPQILLQSRSALLASKKVIFIPGCLGRYCISCEPRTEWTEPSIRRVSSSRVGLVGKKPNPWTTSGGRSGTESCWSVVDQTCI